MVQGSVCVAAVKKTTAGGVRASLMDYITFDHACAVDLRIRVLLAIGGWRVSISRTWRPLDVHGR